VSLLFHTAWENAEVWRAALRDALDGEAVEPLEGGGEADVAVVWNAPPRAFAAVPRLKLVCSLGAGVDHLLSLSPVLPGDIRFSRLVDPVMAERMALHVLAVVLRRHRNLDLFERQQRDRHWRRLFHDDAADTTVAVLGQGSLGRPVAAALAAAGFKVVGWARSPRTDLSWPVYSGMDGLHEAVAGAAFVVAVLPLTAETRSILSAPLFAMMRPGAYLVNVGRGEQMVARDLLDALDAGRLSGAALDAFESEPLPPESPLWSRREILITPHVASLSNPATGARAIAAEICRFRSEGILRNEVFCDRQY